MTTKRLKLKLRREVYGRDGKQCQCCHVAVFEHPRDRQQQATVHHIKFKSDGGMDKHRNLVTLCRGCHEALHRGEIKVRGTHAHGLRFIRPMEVEYERGT
jgi:5-methylcytosine-specific restriction endonuclease McrA